MEKYKALFAGFAAALGAGGIAAYNGAFSPETPPAAIVSQADPAKAVQTPEPAAQPAADTATAAKTPAPAATQVEPTQQTASAGQAAAPAAAAATANTLAPTFDILRVEPSGSVLIAGKSDPDSQVEILNGNEVIGKAKAEANGDFAIVLDNPLKPGDYQLVLRATKADGTSANSAETATVSVPDQLNGPVLALVEQPGKPSRIITADAGVEAKVAVTAEVPAAGEVKQPEPATQTAQAASGTAAPAAPETSQTPATPASGIVSIEAVEVENDRVFVAGAAGDAKIIRLYANDLLLGDARPGADGRYLLDVQTLLAPGDYIVRAEGLAADGSTMLNRVSVPFKNGAVEMAQQPASGQQASSGGDTATPTEPQKKTVIIRRGDTLWQISRRIYGRGIRYSAIYTANQDVTGNPNRIFPGQVFTIPEKTPEGDSANAAEIAKRANQPE